VNTMAKPWTWHTLFSEAELDEIERFYLLENYDADRIYHEKFYPNYQESIEDELITAEEIKECIRGYIRDLDTYLQNYLPIAWVTVFLK